MIESSKKLKKKNKLFRESSREILLVEKEIEEKNTKLHTLFKSLFLIKNYWKNVLYVDIPFCKQRCRFCTHYFKCIPRNLTEVNNFYNKILSSQISAYQEILEKTKFDQVAFGGGTPTIAGYQSLERIFKKIPNFKEIRLKIIEASPDTLTDRHIDLFRKYNFTTISIGVQTFSSSLLRKQGRSPLDIKKLKYFCKKIEQYGMISSIDLILFLDETSSNDLLQEKRDLEYAISELRPVEIVLHTKYCSKRTSRDHSLAIKLIKEMLNNHPEYICVNSLLEKNEAVNQAYRLMRKSFDYTFYIQSVSPHTGNYGYNILPLGYYRNFWLWGSFYNLHFDIMNMVNSKLYFKVDGKLFFDKYKYYNTYVDTRKKLGLHYDKFNENNFFIKKTDQNKFQELSRQIKKIAKNLNELYLRDKDLRGKVKKIIKRSLKRQ